MSEIKITERERLPFMSSRLGMAKERITELEDMLIKTFQTEIHG